MTMEPSMAATAGSSSPMVGPVDEANSPPPENHNNSNTNNNSNIISSTLMDIHGVVPEMNQQTATSLETQQQPQSSSPHAAAAAATSSAASPETMLESLVLSDPSPAAASTPSTTARMNAAGTTTTTTMMTTTTATSGAENSIEDVAAANSENISNATVVVPPSVGTSTTPTSAASAAAARGRSPIVAAAATAPRFNTTPTSPAAMMMETTTTNTAGTTTTATTMMSSTTPTTPASVHHHHYNNTGSSHHTSPFMSTPTSHAASVPSTPTTSTTPTNMSLLPTRCINPASDINSRLDTQVEVRVYPCNNSAGPKKKYTTFTIKPEGVVIQGSNRNRPNGGPHNNNVVDLGAEYAAHIGRKLQRYELSDNRACQLLVTTHAKNFWVVPAPEAFSRHSGTCRLLGDRKHPPAPHTLQVGDFLRVGSVGVVVIETHDGITNCVLSEEKIQRIMKDTTATGGFLDLAETDGENSDDSMDGEATHRSHGPDAAVGMSGDNPVCYMCFDEEDTEENPMITPCKCSGDTKFVHVECLRKWHTAEADNQICFLSSVDATCSVCKSTFKSDFKLRDGRQVKLFKSSLEPPYVSLLVATKHEMAQRLFNTRFQLSFSTLMKPDGRNAHRPLLLGRSSGSDMVLDYRTVSARHAAIRFKNGEFLFTDAGSSNGSYLYLRRPLELSPSQAVQFRLGRSMISMKVVNKWNRRLLRAVRGQRSSVLGGGAESDETNGGIPDDRSIGSTDGDVRIAAADQTVTAVQRRTRESVMAAMPPPGLLSQSSSKHLDLLYALAYPKRENKNNGGAAAVGGGSHHKLERSNTEMKEEDEQNQLLQQQLIEQP